MRKVKDSVVVVTGASSGIGRATALACARKGATVVLAARREAVLDAAADACREAGADALALTVDVTDAHAVEDLARQVVGTFGRIDVWVNNAAVNLFARIEEAPPAEWRRVVETNVFGTYHGMRAVIPWFREQGSGVLVNVSSVLGKLGSPYQSAYVASKHAIRALSDCARQELIDAPGIHVCTVLPGPIDTPLFQHAANYTGHRIQPVKPVIDADRVAAAIVSCATRPRREVTVGASTLTALAFNRVAPGVVERVAARQIDRDHLAEEPAPPTPGNVLEATEEGADVSGGWTRTGRQVDHDDPRAASNDGQRSRLRTLAVVGAVGAAVTAALRRRG